MSFYQKLSLLLMRLTLGWVFVYAGLSKILTPHWSAEGFLKGAKSLSQFYALFTDPSIIPYISFVNKWALLLLGLSLILGICIRISAPLGALLMVLYYFPHLAGTHPDPTSFIVDSHWVYAAVLMYLGAAHAGRTWSLYAWCVKLPLCKKYPKLRAMLD